MANGRFEAVTGQVSFPQLEEEVLARWRRDDTLHAAERAREGAPLFVFYEGPPTANGSPGIHHVLARSFKDIIVRYRTMRGYRPIRRGGWDTHGLPVELEVEKELGLASKQEIEAYGIEEFNRQCRESVFRYVKDWEALTERSGVWLDMGDAYVTYDNAYIESCWKIFRSLWDQGLMYEGFRVTPHCPRCVTSLSSHEVALGYRDDVPDPSIYVRLPVTGDGPAGVLGGADGVSLLVWTTTPWTLTANMAVAAAPQEQYVVAESTGEGPAERVVVAAALVEQALGDGWREATRFTGSDLAGVGYRAPYGGQPASENLHRVLIADYVTVDDGTGLVHTAPAYGAEDAELGRFHGLETRHSVDLRGVVGDGYPGAGKFVKDADTDIVADLEARGLLFSKGVMRHTYPYCWRCDTPLLYYAKASWHIRTTARKEELVAANRTINWYPEHVKEGRFGEWLRNNIDWAVSRERYWGTPLPIWRCAAAGCGHEHCVGSLDELRAMATAEARALSDGLDLHRPFVDRIELACPQCGCAMRRVPEVADAWFDSGAMPFAQWKYPVTLPAPGGGTLTLDGIDSLRQSAYYPADYICEAVDQTRGWFYSLLALSTLVDGRASYRNVICLGLILDEKGEKMSKSRGNIADPWEVINRHGADALRWYLYTAASTGSERRFSANLVQESLRRYLLTLWNTYAFFTTYAAIDGFVPEEHASLWARALGDPALTEQPPNELDRWAISELNALVLTVTELLDAYEPTAAARRIEDFVDVLSNWYVRRSRRRFWKSENDDDKAWAYVTLYTCLATLTKLTAPMTPFVADAMYANLAPRGTSASVHLADWPHADAASVDERLGRATRLAMRIASLGRAARSKYGIRVRQPLARIVVQAQPDDMALLPSIEEQVVDELNVKSLEPASGEVRYSVRPNLPLLGPRFGRDLPSVRAAIESADPSALATVLSDGHTAQVGGFTLEPDDVLISVEDAPGLEMASEEGARLVIGIDTVLTPALETEGAARELVHRLQNLRRDAGFAIADRIASYVGGAGGAVQSVLEEYADYIKAETLSLSLEASEPPEAAQIAKAEIGGSVLRLGVARIVDA